MQSVNSVVLSGEVKKKFDERRTNGGLIASSFSLLYVDGERERRITISAFGEEKVGGVIEATRHISEGDAVIVQGKINENSWKKEGEETWNNRTEIIPSKIVNLSSPIESETADEETEPPV